MSGGGHNRSFERLLIRIPLNQFPQKRSIIRKILKIEAAAHDVLK